MVVVSNSRSGQLICEQRRLHRKSNSKNTRLVSSRLSHSPRLTNRFVIFEQCQFEAKANAFPHFHPEPIYVTRTCDVSLYLIWMHAFCTCILCHSTNIFDGIGLSNFLFTFSSSSFLCVSMTIFPFYSLCAVLSIAISFFHPRSQAN